MANPIYNIPGYGAYVAKRQMNEEQPMREMQQAAQALTLRSAIQQEARDRQMRDALAASGGNIEQAMTNAIKAGDLAGAVKLAEISEAQRARQPQQRVIPAGAAVLGPDGRVIFQNPAAERQPASPEIVKLQQHLATLQPGDPNRAPLEARIKMLSERPAAPAGVTVNVTPNGPLIPGKTAQNKVDEDLLNTGMRLQQLNAIEKQFKPEYQQLGTRFNALALSVKDKVGLTDLDPGERQQLTEFSQFKRNSIDALNQYIKSVTGAAMTNAEAVRIMRGLPNPGTGLFDGDSPTEFEAKLQDAIKQVRMAEARLVYIKRKGMSLDDVSLDQMPSLMNSRGAEIEKAIRKAQPKIADQDVRKQVKRYLAAEFGLVE